jgi:poly-gamma-glutamate synthesis protein (capsule biosynthesis protein)
MKMRFVWPLLGFLILGSCEEAPLYLGMASPSVVSPSMASLTADFRETRLHRAEAVLEGLLTEGDWLSSLGVGLMRPGGGGTGATGAPDLMVELFAGWVFEDSPVPAERTAPAVKVGGDLVLSRTYVVPRAVVRQGRRDTALESCIRGEEDLAALRDLAPPYIALRVNGLSVGDEGYPLVWVIQARIRIDGEGRGGRTDRDKKARVREEALAQLEAGLRERLAVAPDLPVELRPELFWLAAAGDLMLGRGAGDILLREGPGGIFGETAALFKEADLAILNL